MARRLKRKKVDAGAGGAVLVAPALTPEQAAAIAQIDTNPGPFLLFGATGSGKTEVYLHCVHKLLAADPDAQALVMVPEINLTPSSKSASRRALRRSTASKPWSACTAA